MRKTRALGAAVVVVGALTAATLVTPTASGSPTVSHGRQRISGSRPAWQANPRFKQVGTVAADKTVSAKVWLAPNNAGQLASLAQAVSDPSSAQHGAYLSHDQYVTQFAPTTAQVDEVTHWLTGVGLAVDSVGSDNHYLAVHGTADDVSAAFGTTLGRFTWGTKTVQAPNSALSVPGSLDAEVLAVTGLTPAGHKVQPQDLGAPDAYVNATPCSSYYGQRQATTLPRFNGKTLPYAVCGYTPDQLRGAYGVDATRQTGRGQTVAITDAFDASTLSSDASTYARRHGDPALRPGQFEDLSFPEGDTDVSEDPIGDCGGNGWYGEQALDVEAVHAMATSADIEYVGAASCYDDDLLAALSKITQLNKASIVSNSWGEPTFVANLPEQGCTPTTPCAAIDQSLVNAYDSIFQQGAVQGIGFYFSSGDDGDEGASYGYVHPDYPTGDPWVTSVGGTSLGVDARDRHIFETGWGTEKYVPSADGTTWTQVSSFLYGAGGGYSQIFDEPWYQKGVVGQDPTGGRAVPDVAMDADPTTGMLVGETQSFDLPSVYGPAGVHYGEYRIGGTSLASPLLAGAQAVAQEGAGTRIGFANPLLYGLARIGHGALFYDPSGREPDAGNVRVDYVNGLNGDAGYTSSVRTFDQDSSLTTEPGWDDVTGVGTLTERYFRLLAAAGHH